MCTETELPTSGRIASSPAIAHEAIFNRWYNYIYMYCVANGDKGHAR